MKRFTLRCTGLLLLSFFVFLACDFFNPFDQRSNLTKGDYILVLSAGMNPDGTLDPITQERTLAGVRLYQSGYAPKLVLSGGTLSKRSSNLARAMKDIAINKGVPAQDIVIEDRSRSTFQNAIFTSETLSIDNDFLLVTSRFHMARSALTFWIVGYRNFQTVPIADSISTAKRFEGIAREVPAFWFNLARYPVWKLLNLFGRNPETDWILA